MPKFKPAEEGNKYLKEGLPEVNLIIFLNSMKGKATIQETSKAVSNFQIALQWAKKNGWVDIEKGSLILNKRLSIAEIDSFSKAGSNPLLNSLEKISRGKSETGDPESIKVLFQRKLIEEEREDDTKKAEAFVGKEISGLMPELIKTGLWKKVKLKPYNTEFIGKKLTPGKLHILSYYTEKIRNIFFDLGFKEASGPLVESSFWNFDALYQPQDHPAREMADTFYMKLPCESELPDKRLVEEVKIVHESGGATGSSGWRYEWKQDIARQSILRTHTTAVSVRSLAMLEPPAKIFCIGRVFRNETIDYKHLPEFTQVEGIVVDENVSFRDLLGYLKEFYVRMGFSKIRFRPAYFPYTEMSVEPEVYFEERGEWMELGGAGIFRPEVTKPLGIDCPVLAWGLGLERPIMLGLGLNDIRNFYYKNDLDLLRKFSLGNLMK